MASKWFYRVGDDQHGPIESKALKLLAEVGQITPNTLVQKEGASSWAEASRVKGLFETEDLQPPPVIEEANKEAVAIPKATEFAYKVTPSPQVHVVAAIENPPPVVAPAVLADGETTESSREYREHKRRRKSAMPWVFTVLGVLVVAGLGSFFYVTYGGEKPQANAGAQPASNGTPATPAPQPIATETPEEQVFREIRFYSDASKAKTRIANGKVQMRITDVWLTRSEKVVDGQPLPTEFTMNVLLETENLDSSNEVSVNRKSAVTSDSQEVDPYLPLARNGTHGLAPLKTMLDSRVIPAGGKIVETLSFQINSDSLDNFQVALPLAWFRQSGYAGYAIPNVMVSTNPAAAATIAQSPVEADSNENEDQSEQIPANPIVGQTQPAVETGETEKTPSEGEGKLPPPPDFGIPNKPDGENGDQPDDIRSLEQSIKVSVQEGEEKPEDEPAQPPAADQRD